jgi:hypothetical protein
MTNPNNIVALFVELPEGSILKLEARKLRPRLQLEFYRIMKDVVVLDHRGVNSIT